MALKILSFLKLFYFLRYQIFFLFFTFNHLYLFAEVKIIDADTIYLNGDKVRLSGIDAPETAQTCLDDNKKIYLCGKKAKQKLIQLIENSNTKSVNCEYDGLDKYGRFIGNCWVGDILINSWLVENGWALAYKQYSKKFIQEEENAKNNKLGIWKGEFIKPWKWRKGVRLISETMSSNTDCLIKGNISSSGERIYHVPGGQYYNKTKITISKGEKWFCSENDALASGWRRSMR